MKKISLKHISFNIGKLLMVLPYLTLSVSIFLIFYTSWFIYKNIIIAANDAVELQVLTQDIVKTKLNTDLYEVINTEFTKKTEGTIVDVSNLRNPFEEQQEPSLPVSILEEILPDEVLPEN